MLYVGDSVTMADLADRLERAAQAAASLGTAAAQTCSQHSYGTDATAVAGAAQTAEAMAHTWATSLRDRTDALDDLTFRPFTHRTAGPVAPTGWITSGRSDVMDAATRYIRTALDESWFDDVSAEELRRIAHILSGLHGTELNAVIARLSDDELYRWFSELDGLRGGNLDVDEETALFRHLAGSASAPTLWRLAGAERGGKVAEITEAVLTTSPRAVRVRFTELAATHSPGDTELMAAVAGWAELDPADRLVIAEALDRNGTLDRFLADVARITAEPERDDSIPVEFVEGIVGGVVGAVKGLSALTIQGIWDRHAFRKAWGGVAAIGSLAISDPAALAETILDLETLRTNPSYWLGQLAPDVVAIVLGSKGAHRFATTGRGSSILGQALGKLDDMVAVRLRIAPHTVDLFDLFDNRTARASELMRWGEVQGWTLRQNPTGPPRWFDQDGVERLTVKRGSARTPGSEEPHASIRNESGKYLDATGLEAKRESLPSHIPILWDLP